LKRDSSNYPRKDKSTRRKPMRCAHQHRERMDALHRTLDELAKYASAYKIQLGLENRPAHEITNFAEIGEILGWYPDDVIGYWHGTGYAQVQANLGFTPLADWLRAYASRIIGMHLHDARGVTNHHAPGSGNVAWCVLAPLAPSNVLRVLEVDHTVSPGAVRKGIAYLRKSRWIETDER
jgi:sugar phosphate isomerase/epimerase